MGCFDVVCALTNTPIFSGEACHLVILRKDVDWHTVTWLTSSEANWGAEAAVFHGTYDDYGSIETPELTEKQEKVLQGFDDDRDIKHFFVCDTAWRWCQDRHGAWVPQYIKQRREMRALVAEAAKTPIKGKDGLVQDSHSAKLLKRLEERDLLREDDQIALARVMRAFAECCKHPLSGLGQYHQFGGDELVGVRENQELVTKRMDEIEERYARIAEDDDA